jgi:hypothetical protein
MATETNKNLAKQLVAELISSDEFHSLLKSLLSDTIDKKLSNLHSKMEEVKTEIYDKMGNMETEYEKIRGELHEVRVQNDELTKRNVKLSNKLDVAINNTNANFQGISSLQQDQCRNSLRLTGVPESPVKRDPETDKIIPEDTEKIVRDIALQSGITVSEEDLDWASRIPKPKNYNSATPRVIEVRFTRRSVRQKVLLSRTKLKGTGIGVHETITKVVQFVFDQAKDMVKNVRKAKTVWIWNGVPTILVEDDGKPYKYQVRSIDDIKRVAEKHS